jgi:hypothetical protein
MSDDEIEWINDVDILAVKIQRAGLPFDTNLDKEIRTRIRALESCEVRIKEWRARVSNLQKYLDASLADTSGGPPGASVVADSCTPSLDKLPVPLQSHTLPVGTRAPPAAMEGRMPSATNGHGGFRFRPPRSFASRPTLAYIQ